MPHGEPAPPAGPRLLYRRELGAYALVAVATLALFVGLELKSPGYFLWDDNASANLPGYALNWRAVAHEGALAHVNLHQYLGQIWLGNGQSGVLYPPVYVAAAVASALFGDLRHTIDLLALGHLLLAAIGMVSLLRAHRVQRSLAVLGALLWVSFPFLAQVARSWIFVAYVAGLAPWNLLLLARLAQRPSFAAAMALAALKTLLFLQGHVNYAVMVGLLDVVYLLAGWLTVPTRRQLWIRTATAYCGSLLITAALAAPLLLPLLEAQQLSAYRTGRLPFVEYLSNAMGLGEFVRAQVGWMDERAVHQSPGSLFYFGIPNLLLLVAVVPLWRKSRDLGVAAAALLAAAVSWALATAGAAVLYPLPVFSSFRWPFKYYLLFLLFATVAAAVAADAVYRRQAGWKRLLPVALLASGILANAFVLYSSRWDRPFGPYRIEHDVASLRADAERALPTLQQGRIVSLWQRHADAESPRHLTHAYATLLGAYHLGGYDPLIAALNLELALGLEYSNIFRYPLDQSLLDYLSRWSARTLIAPARDDYAELLGRWSQLELHHRDAEIQVWENRAALPIVSWRSQPTTPIAYGWRTNGLEISTAQRTGTLRVSLAPLPWWFYKIDDGPRQAVAVGPDRQLEIVVPPGSGEVTLEYRNVPFRLGLAVAVALVLACGAVALRRCSTRRRKAIPTSR